MLYDINKMWIYTRWNMTSMQQKAYRGVLPELRQCPRRQSINNHSINTTNSKKPYLVFKVYALWHSRMLHHSVRSPVLKNETIDRHMGLDREVLVRATRLFDTKRIKTKTGLCALALAFFPTWSMSRRIPVFYPQNYGSPFGIVSPESTEFCYGVPLRT